MQSDHRLSQVALSNGVNVLTKKSHLAVTRRLRKFSLIVQPYHHLKKERKRDLPCLFTKSATIGKQSLPTTPSTPCVFPIGHNLKSTEVSPNGWLKTSHLKLVRKSSCRDICQPLS